MAEVTLGTLYDFNKQAMLQEPILTVAEKSIAIDQLVEELLNNISAKAYMCLNNERRDFTINTLCIDSNGKLIDLLNGKKDFPLTR